MAWTSFSLSRSCTCESARCAMKPLPKCDSSGDDRPSDPRKLVRSWKGEAHCRGTPAALPDRFPTTVGGWRQYRIHAHGLSPKKIKLTRTDALGQAPGLVRDGPRCHGVNSLTRSCRLHWP